MDGEDGGEFFPLLWGLGALGHQASIGDTVEFGLFVVSSVGHIGALLNDVTTEDIQIDFLFDFLSIKRDGLQGSDNSEVF